MVGSAGIVDSHDASNHAKTSLSLTVIIRRHAGAGGGQAGRQALRSREGKLAWANKKGRRKASLEC